MVVGVVVIGRNEGQRLIACLHSLLSKSSSIVYVDSGSSDGSIQAAENLGIDVIALDMAMPFTAARARNDGLKRLIEKWPELQYVQFVDGDCVLVDGWIDTAKAFLNERADVGVVCGRLREINPDATVYNRLCDIEWDTSIGEVTQCGGIAMMRVIAILEVQGFRSELVAGEEPELCLRLRENDWKIWRIQIEMALHDADIQNFGQWWNRALRGGFAYAEVSTMHARSPKRIWQRELMRAILWGLVLPLAILATSVLNITSLGLFAVYPILMFRIAFRKGIADPMSWQYGVFMTIAKFAEAAGILKYVLYGTGQCKIRPIQYK